jgi:hypothetical protein
MIPHERSLVKRMKDENRPFALVGVNADRNRDTAKKQIEEKKVNWRSFWDDGGTIAKDWRVRGFPTIYVLDGNGVIRYRDVRNEAMERAVETLLKETRSKDSK